MRICETTSASHGAGAPLTITDHPALLHLAASLYVDVHASVFRCLFPPFPTNGPAAVAVAVAVAVDAAATAAEPVPVEVVVPDRRPGTAQVSFMSLANRHFTIIIFSRKYFDSLFLHGVSHLC